MKLTGLHIVAVFLCCSAFYLSDTISLDFPAYFPAVVYDFSKNELTEHKVALGRRLFYDPILSRDNSISCASCHSPYNAFAHSDHDLSHGIDDQIGTRNAPALFNLAWQSAFMWDGAVNHLDMQALAPISHPLEMDESIEQLVIKLKQNRSYRVDFYQAYGDSLITGTQVLKALSQFQLTLVSKDAKYDKVKQGAASFSEQEQKGYALFKQHCNSCHQEPLFSSYSFAANGLPVDTSLNDLGRWMITKNAKDSLLFKIPSLRNLSFSAPYMHDGRFRKLHQVLNHYSGKKNESTTTPQAIESIRLTSYEKTDLIAFLLTLDDKEFVFNPAHQFPRNTLHKEKN